MSHLLHRTPPIHTTQREGTAPSTQALGTYPQEICTWETLNTDGGIAPTHKGQVKAYGTPTVTMGQRSSTGNLSHPSQRL